MTRHELREQLERLAQSHARDLQRGRGLADLCGFFVAKVGDGELTERPFMVIEGDLVVQNSWGAVGPLDVLEHFLALRRQRIPFVMQSRSDVAEQTEPLTSFARQVLEGLREEVPQAPDDLVVPGGCLD